MDVLILPFAVRLIAVAEPRRCGRPSKNDQGLATENNLPFSAAEIAEMSRAEIRKLLSGTTGSLTEPQRQLIRQIRKRGERPAGLESSFVLVKYNLILSATNKKRTHRQRNARSESDDE